ncbi:acyltransferase [soil metagenome]
MAPQNAPVTGGFSHISQLDGIRGLAIALIVTYHFLSSNDHTTSRVVATFIGARSSLWVGVDLFFALSGFLITGILFDTVQSRTFLRSFYGRRSVRIFPLYFLALAVIGVMIFAQGKSWQGYQWPFFFYLNNTPLVLGQIVPEPLQEYSNHLWSLALEEQFYLLWPFAVLLVKDRRKLMTLAVGFSLVALIIRVTLLTRGWDTEFTYKMLPCRMDSLLIGGWLALAVRGPNRAVIIQRAKGVFGIAFLILLVDACLERGLNWSTSKFINSFGYTITAVASTALIAVALNSAGTVSHFFRQAWLRTLGKYSYGIYVWHMIIGPSVVRYVRTQMPLGTSSKLAHLIAGWVLGALVSFIAGFISYQAFEVHFLRLKRFFPYRESTAPKSSSTTT